MNRIVALVRWFCCQLSFDELLTATVIILEVLNHDRPDILCRDAFRQAHPNYRKYAVDPNPPLTECPAPKQSQPFADWKTLLVQYRQRTGKDLPPIHRRHGANAVPSSTRCPLCNAPASYLYFNDGKKHAQLLCKICLSLSQLAPHRRPGRHVIFWCPHCGATLYRWKISSVLTIYKCPNDRCSAFLAACQQLDAKERKLQTKKSSQFKLRYQYREYHFDPKSLVPASPQADHLGRIDRIQSASNTLGLVLTLSVSYGLSSRMTAHMLKHVFGLNLSYVSVLNYLNQAVVLCHQFNLHYKAPLDQIVAGDETYIHVADRWNFAWFTIGTARRAIHAYHLSDSRGTRNALITLQETTRTLPHHSTIQFVADGNPAYDSAVLTLNQQAKAKNLTPPLIRRTIIGLANDDTESTEYRAFKQIIERLNRTYKFHTRARCGFKNFNGAMALTALFVTYYNFLRPHGALDYKTPVPIDALQGVRTIQGQWTKILLMATELPLAA
ncbi:MAG: DDE-type integrase/transposase/recombinase [Kiritimatiellae bacterium]|nr:DDE-type integrase/transposase/recombinase [Kiritimatiellia bacterium]